MKKLIYLAVVLFASTAGFTACKNNAINLSSIDSKSDTSIPILHLADSLFGVQYEDYNFEECRSYFDSVYSVEEPGACSEMRVGNFVGRNLDYSINNNACAIIEINRKTINGKITRYASIGVVGCLKNFTYEYADSGQLRSDLYNLLPGRTMDGINENGVYIGMNVVPIRTDVPNDGYFSEKGKCEIDDAYNALYLTRFVLDNAVNVDNAVELVKTHTWYFPRNYPDAEHKYQPFHWMIADATKNCVMEMQGDSIVTIETKDLLTPSCSTVMTNFSNLLWSQQKYDRLGIGYERFEKLSKLYKDLDKTRFTYIDILQSMQKVWFSNSYTIPIHSNEFWMTELSSDLITSKYLHNNNKIANCPFFETMLTQYTDNWKDEDLWFKSNSNLWFTVHTSVYDIKNRILYIMPHEGSKKKPTDSSNDIFYKFQLDTSKKLSFEVMKI